MPSKKGMDQALTWLKSKANEKNTLDAVNAELCINVIMDLRRQYDRLGGQFNNLRNARYAERSNAPDMAKPENAVLREEQMTFFEGSTAIDPRTTNMSLNEKGDVHNETIRKETAAVRSREPDR